MKLQELQKLNGWETPDALLKKGVQGGSLLIRNRVNESEGARSDLPDRRESEVSGPHSESGEPECAVGRDVNETRPEAAKLADAPSAAWLSELIYVVWWGMIGSVVLGGILAGLAVLFELRAQRRGRHHVGRGSTDTVR